MSTPEDIIKNLQEQNNELVHKVQHWKMTAAQRENEKLELMKESNELRLKLSRIKSGGAAEARKLDAALQSASEEALSHLVQASGAVARIIELAKTYMRDREELENEMPRWSNISGRSNNDRVHRVPPMMGGQTLLPVVSLRRAILNTSNPRVTSRSPNPNSSITERAVPMHMLQDVIIPLTRIDANDIPGNLEADEADASNIDDSSEDLDISNQSQNITDEDLEVSRRLDAVSEDFEPEDEEPTPPSTRSTAENPLEGPSWLLDVPTNTEASTPLGRLTLEPDSTTEPEEARVSPPVARREEEIVPGTSQAFSPTVRRRRRAAPPPAPEPPHRQRRPSINSRVLKVVLPKMRFEEGASPGGGGGEGGGVREEEGGTSGAAKRSSRESPPAHGKQMRFDAPSPNGATVAGVIVSEALEQVAFRSRGRRGGGPGGDRSPGRSEGEASRSGLIREALEQSTFRSRGRRGGAASGGSSPPSEGEVSRSGSAASRDSRDSDREGRTRRPRKPVTYKEMSLVCKLRR